MALPADTLMKPMLVVAIDFGTTYSGCAFAFPPKVPLGKSPASCNWSDILPGRIFMNKAWSDGRQEGVKTPCSVLLDRNSTFTGFGTLAEMKYASQKPGQDDYFLFRHFKMKLHNIETITENLAVESTDGKLRIRAMDLVVMSLKHMRDCLLKELGDSEGEEGMSQVRDDEIRWVVTVPAIWSDVSRSFMRQAAHKAGLITKQDSPQLILALEPEAASFYIRTLDSQNLSSTAVSELNAMPPGTEYVVVDIGGGTVDVTVHRVKEMGRAEEMWYATGGPWGGMKVNDGFEELLSQVWGPDFIKLCKREHKQAWYDLMKDIEYKKRMIKEKDKAVRVSLSQGISSLYKDTKKQSIEVAFKDAAAQAVGVMFKQGFIIFKAEAIEKIFSPSVESIVAHLKGLFSNDNVKGVRLMLLAGGYAESPYLRSVLEREFSPLKTILTPKDASLAVMKGAVLFGCNPYLMLSRYSKKTYGTGTHVIFVDGIHDPLRKTTIEGRKLCKDVFKTFVKKGELVSLGEKRTFEFTPLESDSTHASFVLYISDRTDVEYVEENIVRKLPIRPIEIPVSITTSRERNVLQMDVIFGKTEIEIEIKNMADSQAKTVHTIPQFEVEYK